MTYWQVKAACRGFDTEIFFAEDTDNALKICAGCPVKRECRESQVAWERQMAFPALFGVFGGTIPETRQETREAKTCEICGAKIRNQYGVCQKNSVCAQEYQKRRQGPDTVRAKNAERVARHRARKVMIEK